MGGVKMKELKMITIISGVILWLALAGCSTIKIHYLPTDSPSTYSPTDSVEVFWEKPAQPHVILGLVSAECEENDRALLLKARALLMKEVKKKAMEVGAQGIIIKDTSAHTGTVGVPPAGGLIIAPVTIHRLVAYAIRFGNKKPLGH
jgi:uncharacterized protein YceK